MTRFCEDLTPVPSETQGWVQWSSVNADGSVTPLYGLEAGQAEEVAFYYLSAAGICEIRGQNAQGQALPVAPLTMEPAPVTGQVTAQGVDTEPISNYQFPGVWIVPVIVVGMAVGAWWSMRRTRATDPTPNNSFSISFNKEEDGQ